jgi:hypothetical protein
MLSNLHKPGFIIIRGVVSKFNKIKILLNQNIKSNNFKYQINLRCLNVPKLYIKTMLIFQRHQVQTIDHKDNKDKAEDIQYI